MIPPNIKLAIDNYFDHRQAPGGFIEAVLANDLIEAFKRANDISALHMKDIVDYLYNECPSRAGGAWGSHEAIEFHLSGESSRINAA